MKKTTVIALSALLFSSPVLAADHGGGKGYQEKRVQMMSERLDLDDSQRAALREILTEQHQTMQQLRNQTRGKIEGILNPQQQEAYQEMREERRSRWEERRGGGR